MRVGILALQGAVEPHKEKIRSLHSDCVEIRVPKDLDGVEALILPGGESSAMIHLLKLSSLWDPINRFVRERPTFGVCAGAILLSKKVTSPQQDSFSAIEMSVERNAYGRQVDSFVANVTPTLGWVDSEPVEGIFIRAPRIRNLGPDIQVLLERDGEPVLVRHKNILASTFHPELSLGEKTHQYFLEQVR